MDLKRLAEAMNRRGIQAQVLQSGERVVFRARCANRLRGDQWTEWHDVAHENPALAFALLDDMEKAGVDASLKPYPARCRTPELRYMCDTLTEGEDGRAYHSKGATRTEAIVNAYLAADAAGLLEKGEGR